MPEFLELKTNLEALQAEGLNKEQTNAAVAEAARYLVAVMTNRDNYLSGEVMKNRKVVRAGISNLGAKYPQLRGLVARTLREALPAEMDSLMVLQGAEEAANIGVLVEWLHLGGRNWRKAGETIGEVYIHPNVAGLRVMLFDFRKVDGKFRGDRHFLPMDWHNKAQAELCQFLNEAARKAKEVYDATRGGKTAMREALEKAGVVKPLKEPKPAPVEIPAAPELPGTEPGPGLGETIRFAEDFRPESEEPPKDKKGKKGGKKSGRRRRDSDSEDDD